MSRPRRSTKPRTQHFGYTHPLAPAAQARCRQEHPQYRTGPSRIACGKCWEAVIRADAVLAAQAELPQLPPGPDPDLIDDIAIERAVAGEAPRPTLTTTERRIAVERLSQQGLSRAEIAAQLGVSKSNVDHILAKPHRLGAPELLVAA